MTINVRSIVSYSKKVAANNAAFAKLPKAERRVAIAKDALAQLLLGVAIAERGVYLDTGVCSDDDEGSFDAIRKAPQCNVCAKGVIMLSAIRHGRDEHKLYVNWDDDSGINVNPEWGASGFAGFTYGALARMEEIFEQVGSDGVYDDNGELIEYSYPYELSHIEDANVRLFGILENVIENDGDFKPVKRGKDFGVGKYTAAMTKRYEVAKLRAAKALAATITPDAAPEAAS